MTAECRLFTPPKKEMEPYLDTDETVPQGWREEQKQKDGKNKRVGLTSILFVEQTRNGQYAAKLREKEEYLADVTGYKVKVVEKAGNTLKSLLVRSDPFAGGKCGRYKCLPCKAGLKDSKYNKCNKRNILYESA